MWTRIASLIAVLFALATVCSKNQDPPVNLEQISPVVRLQRDIAQFNDFHSKMSLAARVCSGIALAIGFHDESISGDEAIAELLRISKKVNLKNVEKFNKSGVSDFLAKLSDLKDPPAQFIDAENWINLRKKWLDVYSNFTSKPENVSVMEEYVTKAVTFDSAYPFDYDFLTNLDQHFSKAQEKLSIYQDKKDRKNMTEIEKDKFASDIFDLEYHLGKIEFIPTKIIKLRADFNGHKSLASEDILESSAYLGIKIFLDFIRAENTARTFGDLKADFIGNMEVVANLSKIYTTLQSDISTIIDVVSARSSDLGLPEHTSGFLNGISDLKKLRNDVRDSWLANSVKNYDQELIEGELEVLQSFQEKLIAVNKTWSGLFDNELHQSTQLLVGIDQMFKTVTENLLGADSTLTMIDGLPTRPTIGGLGAAIKINETIDAFEKFHFTFSECYSKLEEISNLSSFKNFSELVKLREKILFSSDKTKRVAELPKVLQEMANFGKDEELSDALGELKTKLAKLKTILDKSNLKMAATELSQRKGLFETHSSSTDSRSFFEFLGRIKPASSILNKFESVTSSIQHFRKLKKQKFQSDVAKIAMNISQTSKHMMALREIPTNLKSERTKRSSGMNNLVKLEKVKEHSKTFGDAVRYVNLVKNVVDKQADIDGIRLKGSMVKPALDAFVALDASNQGIVEEWGDFPDWSKIIIDLITHVTELTKKVKPNGLFLTDYGQEFSKLAKLDNVDFEFTRKLQVVNKWKSQNQQQTALDPVISGMKALTQLDLRFTRYHSAIDQAGNAIKNINTAFVGFQSSSPSHSTVPTGSPTTESSLRSTQIHNGKSERVNTERWRIRQSEKMGLWVYVVISVLVVVLIIVLIIAVRCAMLKKESDEQVDQLQKQIKDLNRMLNEREAQLALQASKHAKEMAQRMKSETKSDVNVDEMKKSTEEGKKKKKKFKGMGAEKQHDVNNVTALTQYHKDMEKYGQEIAAAILALCELPKARNKFMKLVICSRTPLNEHAGIYGAYTETIVFLPWHQPHLLKWWFLRIRWKRPSFKLASKCGEGVPIVLMPYRLVSHQSKEKNKKTVKGYGRDPKVECWEDTRVKLKSDPNTWYSINKFQYLFGHSFVAEMPYNNDQMIIFLDLICENQIHDCILIADDNSDKFDHFPRVKHNDLFFGDYMLRCITVNNYRSTVEYELNLYKGRFPTQNLDVAPVWSFYIHEFTLWRSKHIPTDDLFINEWRRMIQSVQRYVKNKYMVYDFTGGHKPVLFASIDYVVQNVCFYETSCPASMEEFIQQLKGFRGGNVLQNPEEIMFLFSSSVFHIAHECSDMVPNTARQFRKHRKRYDEVLPEGAEDQMFKFKHYNDKAYNDALRRELFEPAFHAAGIKKVPEAPNKMMKNVDHMEMAKLEIPAPPTNNEEEKDRTDYAIDEDWDTDLGKHFEENLDKTQPSEEDAKDDKEPSMKTVIEKSKESAPKAKNSRENSEAPPVGGSSSAPPVAAPLPSAPPIGASSVQKEPSQLKTVSAKTSKTPSIEENKQ